ncbi:MAG TPA: hypothetical protein VF086_11905 [Propionibacteriaceae bacterium]
MMLSQPLGPLVVSKTNPRYFAVAHAEGVDEKPIYLTGSHVNNNFHDGLGPGRDCPSDPERFDFDAYLDLLSTRGHNFIRLWRWEQFRGHLAPADVHFCMTPQPWLRTGPGSAKDGKPKFDLSVFDQTYFDRLRERIIAAGRVGIYASVMLFEGFSLHLTTTPDNIEGHPFHAGNNINDIGITSILDYQVLPLDARVEALQQVYIRKVIDTVHDLPNVLYEVANESSGQTADSVVLPDGSAVETPIGDSTQWQYRVINSVKDYEHEMGYDPHPIGMTYLFPVDDLSKANEPLWNSPADWISPGFDDTFGESRWLTDPPANDGSKVVLLDTDHFSPFSSNALWVWKSFLRGHNPILYDLGILGGGMPPNPSEGNPSFDSLEHAMGETCGFAERISLTTMSPRTDLSETGFALADPGNEYLILQPSETGDPFTMTLTPGRYAVEWHSLGSRKTVPGTTLTVADDNPISSSAPFEAAGPAVVHLRRISG